MSKKSKSTPLSKIRFDAVNGSTADMIDDINALLDPQGLRIKATTPNSQYIDFKLYRLRGRLGR
jgi:hypothetical protein